MPETQRGVTKNNERHDVDVAFIGNSLLHDVYDSTFPFVLSFDKAFYKKMIYKESLVQVRTESAFTSLSLALSHFFLATNAVQVTCYTYGVASGASRQDCATSAELHCQIVLCHLIT